MRVPEIVSPRSVRMIAACPFDATTPLASWKLPPYYLHMQKSGQMPYNKAPLNVDPKSQSREGLRVIKSSGFNRVEPDLYQLGVEQPKNTDADKIPVTSDSVPPTH